MDNDYAQLTWYGYEHPGDPDYDSNSAAGIGDHQNALSEGLSAALTQSERYARFGTIGKSTGQEFDYNGMHLRDDDTAPELNRRVDVYSPSGPGLFGTPQEPRKPEVPIEDLSQEEFQQKYVGYLPEYHPQQEEQTSEEEKPKEKLSPLDKSRLEFPQFRKLSDEQLTNKLHEVFPDVAIDKLAVYVKQPDGAQLIKDDLGRGLTPLEKFKKFYPDKAAGKTDDQVITWMHDNLEPKTDLAEFKEKVNPPPPIVNALKHALDNPSYIPGTGQAKPPDTNPHLMRNAMAGTSPDQTNSALSLGVMAGAQSTYGKWEQFPKATTDALAGVYKAAGVYGWEKAANDWLGQNVPGYGAADDYFRGFVNHLNNRGKEFEKQADQAQAAIPSDVTGEVAGTVGQVAGSIPDIAVSFGLGSTGRAAALWGMAYEGTSAYGHAIENQQKNALLQGVTAAGFRQFSQYLMNSGSGRLASGIQNSIATVADSEVQKWLQGQPNDITKDGKEALVGLLVGLLMGKGKAPKAKEAAPEAVEPGVEPKFSEAQLKGEEVVNPSGKPESTGEPVQEEFTFSQHSAPVNEELTKAHEHHQNGDSDKAAQHIDKALALMDDGQKKEVAKDFVEKVEQMAAPQRDLFSLAQKRAKESKALAIRHGLDPYSGEGEAAQAEAEALAQEKSNERIRSQRSAEAKAYLKAHPDEPFQPLDLPGGMKKRLGPNLSPEEYAAALERAKSQDVREVESKAQSEASIKRQEEWKQHIKGLGATDDQFNDVDKVEQVAAPTRALKFPSGKTYVGETHTEAAKKAISAGEQEGPGNYADIGFIKPSGEFESDLIKPPSEPSLPKVAAIASDDQFNDYYFSGIPFPMKAIDNFLGWTEKEGKKWRGILRPDKYSPIAEEGAAIVKAEQARSKAASVMIPAEIARRVTEESKAAGDINKVRFQRGEVQEKFFNKFTDQERKQQFIDYEEGKDLKDPTANYLYKKILAPIYEAVAKRDEAYGIKYAERDNYVYHLLTHPNDDLPKLKRALAHSGASPDFTEPRKMTIAQRLAFDHKMITTNPVRLAQMRWWASEMQIKLIRTLKQLEEQGYAYESKREDIPESYKYHGAKYQIPTADGKSYLIHPDIAPVINNAFDYNSVYRTATAPWFHFAGALKGTVALKVGLSLFHPIHIMGIQAADNAANAWELMRAGKLSAKEGWNTAFNFVAGGIPGVAKSGKYADAVNILKGRASFKDAPEWMQRDIKDFQDMGLVVEINHERQMQFSSWLRDQLPQWVRDDKSGMVAMGARAIDLANTFNNYWFGEVTPRLKFASAMMRRDTLDALKPGLSRMERLKEFQKINRDIEGRFGEMHYDNLLWPRMLKQIGTTHLLALGWQLGLFRTMGDGVIDLATNAAHWSKLKEEAKARGERPNLFTNRAAFQALYIAQGMMTGAAITAFVGQQVPQIWDMFYPVVGKDPNGKEKRVNMQYFVKDVPAFMEYQAMQGSTVGAAERMASNKMQPMLMAIKQAVENKDWMGHTIGDMPKRILYLLQQGGEPISIENIMASSSYTVTDKIMSVFGYSPSGRWTTRSPIENKIIEKLVQTKDANPLHDAREKYRNAFLLKDKPGMDSARKELKSLKATDKQIANIEKTAHESTAQKAFKRLRAPEQIEMLREMSPEERKEWIKLAHPAVREGFMRGAASNIGDKGGEIPEYAKPGPYVTQLSDKDEQSFQTWVQKNHVPWRDSPVSDYDMRGYWKAMVSGDPNAKQAKSNFDGHMHFPDTYKTPYHKTFSNESKYAKPDAPHWVGDKLIDKRGNVVADETPK